MIPNSPSKGFARRLKRVGDERFAAASLQIVESGDLSGQSARRPAAGVQLDPPGDQPCVDRLNGGGVVALKLVDAGGRCRGEHADKGDGDDDERRCD